MRIAVAQEASLCCQYSPTFHPFPKKPRTAVFSTPCGFPSDSVYWQASLHLMDRRQGDAEAEFARLGDFSSIDILKLLTIEFGIQRVFCH
jgi:hypothetical protein